MSSVNADLEVILNQAQNLKNALESVSKTKSYLSSAYQKLGVEWNDKKYKELGDIILECDKALANLIKILQQGEKYVSAFAKSLQEYEEINFGNTTTERSHPSFMESLRSGIIMKKKSETEKLQNFKAGLNAIDLVIDNYAQCLESRGLQRGSVMNAILDQQRHLQQAELLRNINGDFSNPVSTLTESDFDSIIDNCCNGGLQNYVGVENTPRSLATTRYGFITQIINGAEMRVYNDPVGTNFLLIERQGTSHYDMEGTCGLCQCSNLLTMAGVHGSTEDFAISAAMHSSDDVLECMELFNSATEERGGTTARGRQEILFQCNLPTYCLPVSYNRNETIQRLSETIQTGHGVIVSVDVTYLWRNGQSGGHAISLISVSEDGNTFIYNDTGSGRMGTISANDLSRALTGRPANVTTNIIR